jgi:hypothetical protein
VVRNLACAPKSGMARCRLNEAEQPARRRRYGTNTTCAIGSRIVLNYNGPFIVGYRLMRNFAKCIFLACVWRRCDGLALATAGRVKMPSITTKTNFLKFILFSLRRFASLCNGGVIVLLK